MTITRDELEKAMGGGHAFIHPDEIKPFCDYAARAHKMVEIGTGYGACTCLMLMSSPPSATVYSVDPFLKDTHGTWTSSEKLARTYVQNAARVLKFDAARWTLMAMYSDEAAQKLTAAGTRVDLVFVDGDHTYKGVMQDVESWLPLLRVGGVMLLHDSRRLPGKPKAEFHRGWPGPTRAARTLKKDPRVKLVENIHSFTIWEKLCP